jgi:hypothetical protein
MQAVGVNSFGGPEAFTVVEAVAGECACLVPPAMPPMVNWAASVISPRCKITSWPIETRSFSARVDLAVGDR